MKLKSTIAIAAVAVLALVLFACGEQPPEEASVTSGDSSSPTTEADSCEVYDDSLDLVTAANDATDAVTSVSYDFRLYGTGTLEEMIVPLEGSVILLAGGDDRNSILVEAEYPVIDSLGEVVSHSMVVAATDGETAWLMMEETQEFKYGLMSDGAFDLLDPVMSCVMYEYIISDPFSDEINASHLSFEGTFTVDGEECGVLDVVYPYPSRARSKWYFGQFDDLPRRVDRLLPDGGGAQVLELSSLVVDPEIDPSAFELIPPDGYSVEEYMSFLPDGSVAPLWELPTPDGGTLALVDLRGSIVVMDFWATWCGPCQIVMPSLQELHETYADSGVVVVGVDVWETADPVAFMEEGGYTYTLVLDGDPVADEYLVTGIPTFYVIGPEGDILFSARGADPANEEAMMEVIEAHL